MRDMDAELAKEIEAYKSWKERFGGFSRDMTLRDHFAGLAMQSLVAYPDDQQNMTFAEMAEWAYAMADAMLEARKT